MRIKKKLHYILKYIMLALPILFLFFGIITSQNSLYGTIVADINDLLTEIVSYTNSNWYTGLLDIIGIDVTQFSYIGFILCYYPLYVFYVYLFDLMLDIICFMPKFMHKLMEDFINE